MTQLRANLTSNCAASEVAAVGLSRSQWAMQAGTAFYSLRITPTYRSRPPDSEFYSDPTTLIARLVEIQMLSPNNLGGELALELALKWKQEYDDKRANSQAS